MERTGSISPSGSAGDKVASDITVAVNMSTHSNYNATQQTPTTVDLSFRGKTKSQSARSKSGGSGSSYNSSYSGGIERSNSVMARVIHDPQTIRTRILISCMTASLDTVTDMFLIWTYFMKAKDTGHNKFNVYAGVLIFVICFSNCTSLLYHIANHTYREEEQSDSTKQNNNNNKKTTKNNAKDADTSKHKNKKSKDDGVTAAGSKKRKRRKPSSKKLDHLSVADDKSVETISNEVSHSQERSHTAGLKRSKPAPPPRLGNSSSSDSKFSRKVSKNNSVIDDGSDLNDGNDDKNKNTSSKENQKKSDDINPSSVDAMGSGSVSMASHSHASGSSSDEDFTQTHTSTGIGNTTMITNTSRMGEFVRNTRFTVGNDQLIVETDDGLWVTPYKYSEIPWFHYPLYLCGLGTVAASVSCFRRGVIDQCLAETRYFEVLMESLPASTIQLYALATLGDVDSENRQVSFIEVLSVIVTLWNIGWGTANYFSRNFTSGNILEMSPVMFSWENTIYLGVLTTSDLITRVLAPLFLFRAIDNPWINWGLILIGIILETVALRYIHGDWITLSLAYGWISTITASVNYFAAVGTRYRNVTALMSEIVIRGLFNVGCFYFGAFVFKVDWQYRWMWISLTIGCFLISHFALMMLHWNTYRWMREMKLPPLQGKLGTRDFQLFKLVRDDLALDGKCCLRNRRIM